MRAIVSPSFGETPVIREVERPSLPPGHVRVRLACSSIGAGDGLMAAGRPWVFRPVFAAMLRPPILGRDVAGVVVEVGDSVEALSVGDRVVGEAAHAWAEEVIVREDVLAVVPGGVSLRDAATLPVSARTALQGLQERVGQGSRVLVVGASGNVGHFAVQIAAAMGAHVTGVCSAAKAERVRALGAERIIDYREELFTAEEGVWDVIFDLAGTEPLGACLRALADGGLLVHSAGTNGGFWLGPIPRLLGVAVRSLVDRRIVMLTNANSAADLRTLLEMMEAGRLRPWVGREVAFEGIPAAIEDQLAGRTSGKTVIRLPGNADA